MSSRKQPADAQAPAEWERLTTEVHRLRRQVAALQAQRARNAPSKHGDGLLGAVFERTGVAIVLTDIEDRIIEANQAFVTMLGYDFGELNGRNLADITHPGQFAATPASRLAKIAPLKSCDQLEQRFLTKDGRTIWAEVTSTPNFGPTGEFLYTTAVIEDTTARRKAEAALQRSESLLAEAQQITHTGSWERDLATDEEY